MKKNLFSRLLCASLAVLMVVCILPALSFPVSAASTDTETTDYTKIVYESEAEYLETMTKYYDNGAYSLYCDNALGVVAYVKNATGEALFTNPWNRSEEGNSDDKVRAELMSQIILEYVGSNNTTVQFTSYTDAAYKKQITVKSIKNGLRVEYAMGVRSARILCPRQIEKTAFEEKIIAPLEKAVEDKKLAARTLTRFKTYFNLQAYTTATKEAIKEGIATRHPICEKKNIDIYVLDAKTTTKEMRETIEALISQYCPNYSFEEMDNDYDFVEYEEESTSPPIFKMALEYTVDASGLSVSLPANGLRYDETAYRITNFQILPYMGASLKDQDGYSLIPDGSGTLYELDVATSTRSRVFGEDYALYSNVAGFHNETVRMPVFGQAQTIFYPKLISPEVLDASGNVVTPAVYSETEGETVKRGYFAVIEEGATLASIAPNHRTYLDFASIIPTFITRQNDTSSTNWGVYASRRYTGDYRIRYIILSDDAKAQAAQLPSYYECSWMGMACAYRDYMQATNDSFDRLTEEEVGTSIPLYIETFGCMDTIEKVASMPVTVSVALTSFEDIAKMYDYLAGESITNVNFKLTGYANGGLYSTVPYNLKWEKAVGGKSGFKDLAAYAKEQGFGIYPDFDFVYTTMSEGGRAVKMKENAARTIDNRYTTKRVYSATMQTLVSYYQMVLSPATYNKFYEKLEKKYSKYEDVNTISLSTLGSALNSDYDEDKTVLREEAKDYVIEALAYFKNKNYDVMIEGGNSYTWNYADHILEVPLDSSRYNSEYRAVPFMGVVLHGYVEFAGAPLNMEGDLKYAMLKAMENGASIYFVLSYANTELLKEDELLSQNYSVRYDIWQNRLVDIYNEMNVALGDVQTKLIIGHEFLEGNRIPTQTELLKDIADEMEAQAKALEEKIKAEQDKATTELRLASESVSTAVSDIATLAETVKTNFEAMQTLRYAVDVNSGVVRYWQAYRAELAKPEGETSPDAQKAALKTLENQFDSYIANPMAQITVSCEDAATKLAAAKVSYDLLVARDANKQIVDNAAKELGDAVNNLALLYSYYYNTEVTFGGTAVETFINTPAATVEELMQAMEKADGQTIDATDLAAYILGNDETVEAKYTVVGVEALLNAYLDLLVADGLYDKTTPANSALNYDALFAVRMSYLRAPTPEPDETPDAGEGGEGGEGGDLEEEDIVIPDPPKSKYSMDNALVLVTYGEPGTPYKSFILNFNDYAVQTTVGGVTYTIEGYGYIVIYH